ncbi:MAG: thiamine pyrophosphate-binding protein [Deltaproteobacteria bacterium]|nr:MAG: thiamine pyrophosphate-binding protein [Deltaproteobacteria bacterium]
MAGILGGELVGRMLRAEGVEVVFGIIDGSYFGLYAKLGENGIRLISPRHETTAAHMAGAYARMTGKLGVCIASNGPGAANVLPGVAVENGEGNRVLVISSWRRTGIVDPDRGGTYQYFDQRAVMKPMTKWSGAAESYERIPEVMRRAFRISYRGRPGVVSVTIPEDILNGSFDEAPALLAPEQYRRTAPLQASAEQVRRAADLLVEAETPMIHAGSGVIHARASDALLAVAERLHVPVTTSWGARSAIPEPSRVAVPMNDLLVTAQARNESDLVLVLGSRLGETDWWGKAPYWRRPAEQRLIQVDVDEEILGLNRPVDLAIQADAAAFLEALDAELRERDLSALASRATRLAAYGEARQKNRAAALALLEAEANGVHSARVVHACREFFDDDAVLVVDGGNTAVWTNLFHEARAARSHLSTFKFGMLGAGTGQALGAKVACPDRQVYCIIGDGAMGYHPQEIETAIRNDLPVVFVVMCDRQWGMVKYGQGMALDPERMTQEKALGADETINTDFSEIRFDRLAESMGGHGERVSRPEDLAGALERSVASGRCAVIHVDVDPVVHMWAPGLAVFKAMHLEPEG